MEAPVNDLMEVNTDQNGVEDSTGKASGTQIVQHDSDFQSTGPESRTTNISQELDVVELSSDDEVQIIGVKRNQGGQKSEKSAHNGRDPDSGGRTSPQDITCSVCLSEYDNKAFLDKCFHAFCYFCILQWSEIVRTCPLCKSSFTSIIHSVKSIDNYQQHYLSKPDTPVLQQQPQNDGRRFRYRTTLTDGNRQHQRQRQRATETDPWGQQERRRQGHIAVQRDRKAVARERRRTIYSNNLWAQGVTQEGRPRQREISPEFFRTNPACSHRLIPWLTRELRVLLNDVESHVNFVLQIVLSLITKVELNSEEFCSQLQPFLFDKTEHFIHEFINFARSPFDLKAYDERAQYNWPNESRDQVTDTPTVFHSQSSSWQTPVPGPSGESMLLTDWDRDSPVIQREQASWSSSSSPGPSGLNLQPSVVEIVTVSSGSSHTVLTNAEHSGNEETVNAASHSKRPRSRSRSISEAVKKENHEESRRKHKHSHHHHRHSHKHKHKHKHKKKDSKKHKATCSSSEQPQAVNSLENDMGHASGSKSVSIVSSESNSPPVEVIVVDSDSSSSQAMRAASRSCSRSRSRSHSQSHNSSRSRSRLRSRNLSRSRSRSRSRPRSRHLTRSRSRPRLRSRSRSVSKGKRILHGKHRWRSRSGRTESRSSRDCSRFTQEQTLKDHHRSRSRSSSRLKERHRSKRERRIEIEDFELSNSEEFSSKRKSLKKEKSHQGTKNSRSRSQSHSRSKTKLDSKVHSEKFERRTKVHSRSCSTSESSAKDEAPSSSRNARSRTSRSRNSRSRSRSRSTRLSRSRSPGEFHAGPSRDSRSHQLADHSIPDTSTRESLSHSNEDIKKEIEDLEVRINADKKRLLKLLIKKERSKTVDVTDVTENELGAGDGCQTESN